MIIDDLIELYRSLSTEKLAKENRYKTQRKIEYLIIPISYLGFILADISAIITSRPFLNNSFFLQGSIIAMIIFLSTAFITTFTLKGPDDKHILDSNKNRVNIDELRNKQMQKLIKEKYIITNNNNSYFFSSILESIEVYDKQVSKTNNLNILLPISSLISIATYLQLFDDLWNIAILIILLIIITTLYIQLYRWKKEISNGRLLPNLQAIIIDMKIKNSMRKI